MATADYNFTQQELYTIVELALNSVEQNLTDFSNFKARYTLLEIGNVRTALAAARQLPDEEARNADSQVKRIQLTQLNRDSLDLWQQLKRYIADAFPSELQHVKLNEAGHNYYNNASNENWDSTKGLLSSASLFISNNLADLTANQNMPPAFQTDFDTAKTNFEDKHQSFLDAEEQAVIQTQEKITANNDLYTILVTICLDGQEIFREDEAHRKEFTISELLYLASGNGTAGIRGYVTDSVTLQPIENVSISLSIVTRNTATDADGHYELLQLAANTYDVQFFKEGYQNKIVSKQVTVGTVSTLSVQLTPNP